MWKSQILAGNLNSSLNYVITTVHRYVKFSNVADWCNVMKWKKWTSHWGQTLYGVTTSFLFSFKSAWLFSSALCHWGHFKFKKKTLEQESFKREIQNYFFSIVYSFYINSTRLKNFTDTRMFLQLNPNKQ